MPPIPDETTESTGSWLRENLVNIVLGLICLTVVLRYLDPLSVVLAGAGLTFIIFIHELGHFAAAKLCNVRVEAFSIGFGPPLPFCSYKYGETTYKLCLVPLGGFVKMLGEGDGTNDDTADTDPRSFKNQSVPERMLIISAGVIMNILLACVLFVIVYMHGLEEIPATVARMEAGGTAWRLNIHSGSEIRKIGNRENPWFDDLRPIVWATNKGDLVDLKIDDNGTIRDLKGEPIRDEGAPFPVLGILPMESLSLIRGDKFNTPPFIPDSAASQAKDAEGHPLFHSGDTLVGMSDPDTPDRKVTPIKSGANDARGDIFVYHRRLARLATEPITFEVTRTSGETASITVPPAYRRDTGMRMRMGSIVATRVGSPAEAAKVQPKEGTNPGDRIVEVEFANADKTVTVLTSGKVEATTGRVVKPLDPLKLPTELTQWADRTPGPKRVTLTVWREQEGDHAEKRIALELPWDEVGRFDVTTEMKAQTPIAINGLGLAYHVQAVVDSVTPGGPAATAGLQPNDACEAVRIRAKDATGTVDEGRWETIKPHQWAFVDELLQRVSPFEADVRVNRGGQPVEVRLGTVEDRDYSRTDRGLILATQTRIQKANSIGEALQMGADRTLRMIQTTYINLYAMVFGRVSAVQTMSGPITLARISYILAGESVWKLILMLALININLAVVNFLPIPLLDGGHMMFLIYEAFRGKPPPERVHILLTYVGFFFVICLMLFTIGLDIYRLLKVWLRW
ncbi:site-2 protease family protein [Limnoglobus roseus]|nr:site-2 protease family protein [Limnoglobus roseus]